MWFEEQSYNSYMVNMTLSWTAEKSLLKDLSPNVEWDVSEGLILRKDVLYEVDTGITPFSVVSYFFFRLFFFRFFF